VSIPSVLRGILITFLFQFLYAKLRKVERKTKKVISFFLPRQSNFAIFIAKLRKKMEECKLFCIFAASKRQNVTTNEENDNSGSTVCPVWNDGMGNGF